jgi:Ca2+-binding RTX toxin-like protein
MANYTTNFSTWSELEAVLSAADTYQSSASYIAVKSSYENLKSFVTAGPVSSSGTSTNRTLVYGGGVVAYVSGSNFGTPSAVVNRIDFTDGTSTFRLDGAVTAQNTGAFTSYSFTGLGYAEAGTGQMEANGSPMVLSSWSVTLPTALGSLSFIATGTSTSSGNNTAFRTYSSASVADSAGHSAYLTGLSYSVTADTSTPPANLQMLRDMLAGNDTAHGDAAANELRTFDGNDTLDGGGGIDTMVGGAGDDVYIVSQTSTGTLNAFELSGEAGSWYLNGRTTTVVFEAGKLLFNLEDRTHDNLIDYIFISYWTNPYFQITIGADQLGQNLTTGTYINAERASGASAGHPGLDLGFDSRGSNALFGSFTIDAIDIDYGGTAPVLRTLALNFEIHSEGQAAATYGTLNYNYTGTAGTPDLVVELANEGSDEVRASVSCVLADNVERLTLTGTAKLEGSGNTIDNIVVGNVGDNVLRGLAGNDTLTGGQGLDTATYAGPKSAYTVTRVGAGYTVVDTNAGDTGGDEGTDTLSGIEWLQFSDGATKLGRQLNDTSGDGKSDLMWRNSDGSTSLWLMNGTSVQTYGSFGQIPTAWQISASGDFNGDGKTDLLWRHSDGSTSLWLMNGTGVQSYGAFGQIPTTWQITTTGDFNGDGKTDLMWRHTDGSTSLWLMNGTTAQGYGSFGAIPTAWQITATADYNGDGKSDLMWRHTDGSTSLWLMNGTVAQGYGSFGPIPVTWSILDSQGDYNGDGKNDLLWRNATDGTTNLWLMNGTSVQTYGSFGQVATGWNLVDGHGDYNGDGKSDLMWRHSDGSTSLWLMNGTSVQTYGSFGAIPAAWSVIDAHDDYNSDGKSDILWRHSDGSTSLWLMNGTGVQTYGSFGQIPGSWNPVAGADAGATLSGDGGANSLTGTVNNDTLIGLAGNDTLTGSMGADRFVFNTALNAGTNVDTITDFSSGTDKILLDHLILTALTTGTLAASSFVAEAGATAHDGNDYLLYDTTTGNLAYDADGTGAQAAVLFATLTGHPGLVAGDLAGV